MFFKATFACDGSTYAFPENGLVMCKLSVGAMRKLRFFKGGDFMSVLLVWGT